MRSPCSVPPSPVVPCRVRFRGSRAPSSSLPVGALVAAVTICSLPAPAVAHISVSSGPATANSSQEISFGVGHGCAAVDTYRIRMQIPAGVTSVRPMRSDFGKVGVEKNAGGAVVAVTWQKPEGDVLDGDIAYYKLTVRMRIPNQPFTTLYFPTTQTCRAADGTLSVTDWVGTPTAAPTDAGADEPAPALLVLPARRSGWNKLAVPNDIPDISAFFADAAIVWKGAAAYSANPTTAELIAATPGVSALSSVSAGDVVWVRY